MVYKPYPFLLACCLISMINHALADNINDDPYETYNRHAFAMNDTVDKVVYTPVASMYKAVMPDFAETGVTNFFSNLGDVTVVANDALQLKVYQGTEDIWRLFFNTTFGLLGLFDVASKIGLPRHHNDFGMTLANWGYRNSNYFVIPFLGPSTVRDTFGLAADYQVLSIYPYISNVRLRNSLLALNFVQTRAQLLQFEDVVQQAAVDPYTFQRNAYMQRRDYLIAKNLDEPSNSQRENNDPYVDD